MGCPLTGLIGAMDEAGRGPLAGPVVACCVIWRDLPEKIAGINDSKLLTDGQRRSVLPWIIKNAYRIGIGFATHGEIDRINILKASLLSMERAFFNTGVDPDLLLIDGKFGIKGYPPGKPVVKGDRKCFFIASASIVAKVVRDDIMTKYDSLYPEYGFLQNKGYPTRDHKSAIARHGLSPIHRKTFKGVKEYLDR